MSSDSGQLNVPLWFVYRFINEASTLLFDPELFDEIKVTFKAIYCYYHFQPSASSKDSHLHCYHPKVQLLAVLSAHHYFRFIHHQFINRCSVFWHQLNQQLREDLSQNHCHLSSNLQHSPVSPWMRLLLTIFSPRSHHIAFHVAVIPVIYPWFPQQDLSLCLYSKGYSKYSSHSEALRQLF